MRSGSEKMGEMNRTWKRRRRQTMKKKKQRDNRRLGRRVLYTLSSCLGHWAQRCVQVIHIDAVKRLCYSVLSCFRLHNVAEKGDASVC